MIRAGRSRRAMADATVNVFPDPVTPSSTACGRPSRIRRTNRSIAWGWSPRGSNSAGGWKPGVRSRGGGRDVTPRRARAPPGAVLAGVAVPPQDVLLVEGHAVQEGLPDVDGQPDDRRELEAYRGGADDPGGRLDALGFAAEEEGDGPLRVGEGGGVERIGGRQKRNPI